MASEGPLGPGTMATDSSVGTINWLTQDNAKVDDATYADARSTANAISYYLKATNFGFVIPSGATIDGITVEIRRRDDGTPSAVTDEYVQIVKADATIGTVNKADTSTLWLDYATTATYGGVSDLWGEDWSATDINNSNFGVVISADVRDDGPQTFCHGFVEYLKITIEYTGGAAGTNMQINIGDTWKAVASAQVNIGDAWKAVASAKVNIGDTWKTIF